MPYAQCFKRFLITLVLLYSTSGNAGLITNIATETVRYSVLSQNPWGNFRWTTSYDIGFVDQDLLIDVDVYLRGPTLVAHFETFGKMVLNPFGVMPLTYLMALIFTTRFLMSIG